MRTILKALALPVVIVLTPLTWICFGLLKCSAWIFGLAATLMTVIAALFALTVSVRDSLLLFAAAFLVSPIGLPMLAAHIVMGLDSVRCVLRQFICSVDNNYFSPPLL